MRLPFAHGCDDSLDRPHDMCLRFAYCDLVVVNKCCRNKFMEECKFYFEVHFKRYDIVTG